MRCRYCKASIGLLGRLLKEDFCSLEHRTLYRREMQASLSEVIAGAEQFPAPAERPADFLAVPVPYQHAPGSAGWIPPPGQLYISDSWMGLEISRWVGAVQPAYALAMPAPSVSAPAPAIPGDWIPLRPALPPWDERVAQSFAPVCLEPAGAAGVTKTPAPLSNPSLAALTTGVAVLPQPPQLVLSRCDVSAEPCFNAGFGGQGEVEIQLEFPLPVSTRAVPASACGGIGFQLEAPALPRCEVTIRLEEAPAQPSEEFILVLPDYADAVTVPILNPAVPLAFRPEPPSDQPVAETRRVRAASTAGKSRDNVIAMPSPGKQEASTNQANLPGGEDELRESRMDAIRLSPPLAHRLEVQDFPRMPAFALRSLAFKHKTTGDLPTQPEIRMRRRREHRAPVYRATGS